MIPNSKIIKLIIRFPHKGIIIIIFLRIRPGKISRSNHFKNGIRENIKTIITTCNWKIMVICTNRITIGSITTIRKVHNTQMLTHSQRFLRTLSCLHNLSVLISYLLRVQISYGRLESLRSLRNQFKNVIINKRIISIFRKASINCVGRLLGMMVRTGLVMKQLTRY